MAGPTAIRRHEQDQSLCIYFLVPEKKPESCRRQIITALLLPALCLYR